MKIYLGGPMKVTQNKGIESDHKDKAVDIINMITKNMKIINVL